MGVSVNTNYGASIALQQLEATNKQIEMTQSRINTGLKVASAKDNGAIFAIAQGRRSELAGYGIVKQSLDRTLSTLDVALTAGDAISSLLIDMKAKALAATDANLTTEQAAAYDEEFQALRDQVAMIIGNAEFNGVNIVNGGAASITALANHDGSSTISVSGQDMRLGGLIVTLAATQGLQDPGSAVAALIKVEESIDNVSGALATLGSKSRALEVHNEFISKLSDTLEAGIGKLVDADLARESANLQALQTKQQLGIQALSIANSASTIALSFFYRN